MYRSMRLAVTERGIAMVSPIVGVQEFQDDLSIDEGLRGVVVNKRTSLLNVLDSTLDSECCQESSPHVGFEGFSCPASSSNRS